MGQQPRRILFPCLLQICLVAAVAMAGARSATAATITVTSAADTIAVNGAVTFREAITSANDDADLNADVTANRSGTYGADTIQFNIPGAGVHTIALTSSLPPIDDPVTINGYSEGGASPNTNAFGLAINAAIRIELDGAGAGPLPAGLVLLDHTGSVVRGLAIKNFDGHGIDIAEGGGGHTVAGNFIGTDATGLVGAGNNENGVHISARPNNTIGGVNPADRNLIADNGQGNVFAGVSITGHGATGNVVQGNYIGTNATGAVALGNSTAFGFGLILFNGPDSNTIGGAAAGAGNVISGNGGGISIQGSPSPITNLCVDNVIAGNRIGTNAAGTAALPNGFSGIAPVAYATGTVIGGTAAGAGNLISGNTSTGMTLGGSTGVGTLVQGNRIGTDLTGTAAIGNGTDGVLGSDSTGDAVIGGTAAGAGNVIAFNGAHGVHIRQGPFPPPPEGFAILGNSIHGNIGLGIELANDGVTANDGMDGDAGPNLLQNYPVLSSASTNGVSTFVIGSLNSAVNTLFRVEFFSTPACDASGNGEGQTFLGSTSVSTDGTGNGLFNVVLPADSSGVLTATATDPNNNTSEFSACRAITLVANNAPVAVADSYSTDFNTPLNVPGPGVLGNDSDPDGDLITAAPDSLPTNGTLAFDPDGAFLYTPNPGFSGVDSFTYHASDGLLSSNVVTVQLTVLASLVGIPVLDGWGLLLLAAGLAAAAVLLLRR